MKICIVSLPSLNCYVDLSGSGPGRPQAPRGGSERQLSILAEELTRRGHAVTVVLNDYSGAATTAPRLVDVPLLNAYDLRAGLPGIRFLHPRWTGLRRALRRAGAEVYFQQGAGVATGQVALACRELGRPFVFGTASDTDVDPRRVRLGFRARRFYHHGLHAADHVITQHVDQQDLLRRNHGLESSIIYSIIPFFPETPPEPADPPTLLWLGNYRSVKQPEVFLDLARRFPEARFSMVGGATPAEPECFARTRETAEGLANVDFHGPAFDPSPFLARAWVLLNTSRVEGFPSSFLEAWGHGVPTLSFVDPGGVVSRHGPGLVASDPEDMAARLRELLASRERRDAIGARARDYVAREHRADRIADRYLEIFRDVTR